jgi:HPt (histidine-containing phosphotransfer) domain-containing protein/CheY-like chemotaxis protein
MTADTLKALLAGMRAQFLNALPERCDQFNSLILALESTSGQEDSFNELYRGIHSLKGTGGTHGLPIITTLCHQLESLLTEAHTRKSFDDTFVTHAFAYIDLLRQIETIGHQINPDYTTIEASLATLRPAAPSRHKTGLIVESSAFMSGFYQQLLQALPLHLSLEPNGLTALARLLNEPFDIVIVGREITELNGIALMAALRASRTPNQHIPALLITSKLDAIPDHARFNAILTRDPTLADNLVAAVQAALPK